MTLQKHLEAYCKQLCSQTFCGSIIKGKIHNKMTYFDLVLKVEKDSVYLRIINQIKPNENDENLLLNLSQI